MSRRVLVTVLVLAPLLAQVPVGATGVAWSEDFEDLSDWTLSGGVRQDCDVGAPGCSLALDPDCCGTFWTAQRSVGIELQPTAVVSFWFRGDRLTSNTDAEAVIDLAPSGQVVVPVSDGFNHWVGIVGPTGEEHRYFANWEEAGRWYRVEITLDAAASTVQGTAYARDGSLLGTSRPIVLVSDTEAIAAIGFRGVSWNSYRDVFRFDTACIGTRPFPEGCSAGPDPDPRAVLRVDDGYGLAPHPVTFTMSAAPGGGATLTGWSLDFGDGSSIFGEGAPPAEASHAYEAGEWGAEFVVTDSSGRTARDSLPVSVRPRLLIANVTHTPTDPVAYSAEEPDRYDTVVVTADLVNADWYWYADVDVCWRAESTPAPGVPARPLLFHGCRHASTADEVHYEATLPHHCAGTTVVYTVIASDWRGILAHSEGRYTVRGDPVLNLERCPIWL